MVDIPETSRLQQEQKDDGEYRLDDQSFRENLTEAIRPLLRGFVVVKTLDAGGQG